MNCPACGRPMKPGHITGSNVPRILPGKPAGKTYHNTVEDFHGLEFDFQEDGLPLDAHYIGLAPILFAEYCLDCGKVVCQTEILRANKEELK